MMSETGTRVDGPRHVQHWASHHEYSAAGWSGDTTFDLLSPKPHTNIIVTDTVPSGVNLVLPLNLRDGVTTKISLEAAGTNTWTVDAAFTWLSPAPVWAAGKKVFYQIVELGTTTYIAGSIEGGNPVTGGGNLALPAINPGTGLSDEVVWGVAGAEPTFMRGYSGSMSSDLVTDIGVAESGDIKAIISTRGGLDPQNGQSFHVPYAHPDSDANGVGVFVKDTAVAAMTAGTTKRSPVVGTPILYEIWLEYTKV